MCLYESELFNCDAIPGSEVATVLRAILKEISSWVEFVSIVYFVSCCYSLSNLQRLLLVS